MKLNKLISIFIGLCLFASIAHGAVMGDFGSYPSIRISPRDFTAVYSTSNTIECTGGNTANFTTLEVLSITVIATNEENTVIIPTQNRMSFVYPNLWVQGANFKNNHLFRVAFVESAVAASTKVFEKAGYTTTPTVLTFPRVPKVFEVVNYDTSAVIFVQTAAGETWEVDPAIGAAREFAGFEVMTIEVYSDGTASAEIGAGY